MNVVIKSDPVALGRAAGDFAARNLIDVLNRQPVANVILATGASQFETLGHLVASPDIDWSRVNCFHLDEYLGITRKHPASFCRYLRERFVEQLPSPPARFEFIRGDVEEPEAECQRLGELIQAVDIDLALIGIGENGHLAFNDPPADFETDTPYLVVDLDEACRQQQLGEGWFPTLEDVPQQAISMSVSQILKSKSIVCSVPDERKAEAVYHALHHAIDPVHPATALQKHDDTHLFLDSAAASRLPR